MSGTQIPHTKLLWKEKGGSGTGYHTLSNGGRG